VQQTRDPAVPIVVARGDGIGPEIMDATLRVLEAAGARLDVREVEIGAAVYARGVAGGIAPEDLDLIRRTGVFLKAPITTPQGGGVKSLNVTIRKSLGLFANVRPCPSYAPFVPTSHPGMDVVVVRENEEDLYGGIEHRQTDEVVQCLKLISRPGCERIARYAFEYARAHGRRKVTVLTKDNIMKLTDGLFRRVAEEVARVPRHRARAPHRRHRHGAARGPARGVRRRPHAQPLRRHRLRRRRTGRRVDRSRGDREHRCDRRDVRGDPWLGP